MQIYINTLSILSMVNSKYHIVPSWKNGTFIYSRYSPPNETLAFYATCSWIKARMAIGALGVKWKLVSGIAYIYVYTYVYT